MDNNKPSRYKLVGALGSGTYGVVTKAIDTKTKEYVAIKKIKLEYEEEGVPGTAVRECSLLRELNHDNVIPLREIMHYDNRLHLVFEYVDHDLKKFIDASCGPISQAQIRSFVYQILRGIHFCHSRRIMHRDLKPANLLITNGKDPVLKIADFGLARTFGIPLRQFTHEIITLWYRAPEILLGAKHYSTSVDIWSIGCIFSELATKVPLFQGDCEIDQLFKIFETLGTPTEETWPGVTNLADWHDTFPNFTQNKLKLRMSHQQYESYNAFYQREITRNGADIDPSILPPILPTEGFDLLEKMLILDPVKRITAKQALRHPYFEEERRKYGDIF